MAKVVTPADVEAEIAGEEYLHPAGNVTTICVLTLRNGRQVVGSVFGQVYDRERGMLEAKRRAVGEVWPLLVYHAHCEP